jgi:hypothetical protein
MTQYPDLKKRKFPVGTFAGGRKVTYEEDNRYTAFSSMPIKKNMYAADLSHANITVVYLCPRDKALP